MLALALAAALATLPDVSSSELEADDGGALLEALLRGDRVRHAPCEERWGWVGDDDLRDPAPCDDDEDDPWLVAPRGPAIDREDGED